LTFCWFGLRFGRSRSALDAGSFTQKVDMQKIKSINILAVAALIIGESGCTAAPMDKSSFVIHSSGSKVKYDGKITLKGASDLKKLLLQSKIDTLIISSAGGDARAALVIGKMVRDLHLNVVVERYCISACAQYVFVAAHEKKLKNDAVLIFHNSPAAIQTVLRNSPLSRGARAFSDEALEERQFYRSLGIHLDLATLSSVLIPVCVAEMPDHALDDPFRYGVAWRFPGFVPTREQLESVGINNIEGSFPTAATLPARLKQVGFRPNYKPIFAPPIPFGHMPSWTKSVPLCPSNDR